MQTGKRADDKRRNLKGKVSRVDVSLPDTNGAGPFKPGAPPLDGLYNDRRGGKNTHVGRGKRAV